MSLIKKTLIYLIKMAYIAPFAIFILWLLQLAYFPHLVYIPKFIEAMKPKVEVAKTVTEISGKKEMIKKIEHQSDPIPRGHFHITDEYIERLIHQLETNPDLCLKCHGTYPHKKDKKKRSILNLHNGFMACEVCHVRKGPKDDNISFAWVNLKTGEISMKVKGGYGKYPAKIVPIKQIAGRTERLDEMVAREFSQEYLELKNKYTSDQLAEVKKVHEHNLTKEPIICNDCHTTNGYLDLAGLGFSRHRVNRLSSSEIPNMLQKYEKFYFPRMFSPESMKKSKKK